MAVFWVVAPCSLVEVALLMEVARTSETLVNFYQTTRHYNPEDSHLRAHRRENLKSYYVSYSLLASLSKNSSEQFLRYLVCHCVLDVYCTANSVIMLSACEFSLLYAYVSTDRLRPSHWKKLLLHLTFALKVWGTHSLQKLVLGLGSAVADSFTSM
jgi:hypothetical protein